MTRSDGPAISVVIVNYNSGDRLLKCLNALAKQSFDQFETIVIDNSSTDSSLDVAEETALTYRLIKAGENLGFAAANNRAVADASGEWVAFLNPDAYPEPAWLSELSNATDFYPDVEAFGSLQIDAKDTAKLDGAGDAYHVFGIPYRGHHGWPAAKAPSEGECFAPCAAAAMYRKSTFQELGGFEESFFCYCEDVDLGFRLRLAGGRAVQLARAKVLHEGSGVTGKRSAFTVYHGHRNRIWTRYRNTPLILLVATAPFEFLANVYLLLRFALLGEATPYLRALRDGYAGIPAQSDIRRKLQKNRKVSVSKIAKAMVWSPLRLVNKNASLRPLEGNTK